jgi:hypothetical protein
MCNRALADDAADDGDMAQTVPKRLWPAAISVAGSVSPLTGAPAAGEPTDTDATSPVP